MMHDPQISVYDQINPTDNWHHLAMQFYVNGTYGKGLTIVLHQGETFTKIECRDGDTPDTVAQRIVDAWNTIAPSTLNKVDPLNDVLNVANPITTHNPNLIQLVSPENNYSLFSFTFEDTPIIETSAEVVSTTETPKDNTWLWILGGLGLWLLLGKKKKKKKQW